MHHVTGVGNGYLPAIGDRFIALRFIGAPCLAAIFAVDDQHRTD